VESSDSVSTILRGNGDVVIGGVTVSAGGTPPQIPRYEGRLVPYAYSFNGTLSGSGATVIPPYGVDPSSGNMRGIRVYGSGKIVSIEIRIGTARTAGTLTAQVYSTAVGLTGPTAVIDGTNTSEKFTGGGTTAFAAGVDLQMRATGSGFTPIANTVLIVLHVLYDD
jgi:hypothetical protein